MLGAKATIVVVWAASPVPMTTWLLTSSALVLPTGMTVAPAGVSAVIAVEAARRRNDRASPVTTWRVGLAPPAVAGVVFTTSM